MGFIFNWMAKWDNQSDSTRIATGSAFALALMAIVHYVLPQMPNLGAVHPWLHETFGGRIQAIEAVASIGLTTIALTVVYVAYCAMRECRDFDPRVDSHANEKSAMVAMVSAFGILWVVGAAVRIADIATTTIVSTLDVIFFLIQAAICLVCAVKMSKYLFENDQDVRVRNPVAMFATRTLLVSFFFLWSGFNSRNLALAVGIFALAVFLSPIGYKVARQRAAMLQRDW